MAVDKIVDSGQLDSDLEDVADAIRAKGGTSADLAFPSGFISAIENLLTGAKCAKGTITTPSSGTSYTLNFGETFTGNYLVVIEATDATKTAIINSGVNYKRAFAFLAKRNNFTINNLSIESNQYLIERINPSSSEMDKVLSGSPSYTDSSVTIGNYGLTGQYATNCLFQGYSYNFFVVEIQ